VHVSEKQISMKKLSFDLLVDGVPYMVKAEPFLFNEEKRYNVSFNGSEVYVFAWDDDAQRFASLGDDTGVAIPNSLEEDIASRLYEAALVRE
jgi:hypothetical protein